MHSICLGVIKQMCSLFFMDKVPRLRCKLSVAQKQIVSQRISVVRKCIPSEVNQKLCTLKDFAHFKAIEFCHIILYFGPVILKGILPTDFYVHFLCLHCAVYTLCSPLFCEFYFDQAKACIELF